MARTHLIFFLCMNVQRYKQFLFACSESYHIQECSNARLSSEFVEGTLFSSVALLETIEVICYDLTIVKSLVNKEGQKLNTFSLLVILIKILQVPHYLILLSIPKSITSMSSPLLWYCNIILSKMISFVGTHFFPMKTILIQGDHKTPVK